MTLRKIEHRRFWFMLESLSPSRAPATYARGRAVKLLLLLGALSLGLLSASADETDSDVLHEVTFVNESTQGVILLDLPVADFRSPSGRVARFDLYPRGQGPRNGDVSYVRWVFSNDRNPSPDRATLIWQLAEVGYCPEDRATTGRCELIPVPGAIYRWELDLKAMRSSPEGRRMGQLIGPYEGRHTLETRISIRGDTLSVQLSNGRIGAVSWR